MTTASCSHTHLILTKFLRWATLRSFSTSPFSRTLRKRIPLPVARRSANRPSCSQSLCAKQFATPSPLSIRLVAKSFSPPRPLAKQSLSRLSGDYRIAHSLWPWTQLSPFLDELGHDAHRDLRHSL